MSSFSWFPGYMAKSVRELTRYLRTAEFLFYTVDARAPYSTFYPQIARNAKKVTVIFTKTDLADPQKTAPWEKWFRRQGYVVYTNRNVFLSEIRKKFRTESSSPRYALILGLPNVGKSTLLNYMVGGKKAKTGAIPGVTRGPQWVKFGEFRNYLLDTPGVFLPRQMEKERGWKLVALGTMPEKSYADQIFEICESLVRYAKKQYHLFRKEPEDFFAFLDHCGERWKLLQKGGAIHREAVAARLLAEFQKGKWGRISLEEPQRAHDN